METVTLPTERKELVTKFLKLVNDRQLPKKKLPNMKIGLLRMFLYFQPQRISSNLNRIYPILTVS